MSPLVSQAEAAGRVGASELGDPVVGEAALAALADQAGQEVLGAAEAGLGHEHVVTRVAELGLVAAAGVVGDHPVEVAGEQVLPQRLDVLA